MSTHLPDGYLISTDPARLDHEAVHRWLAEDSYWALGRAPEKHRRAVDSSLNFGVYEEGSGRQVAYARIVTDYATFAWLCDVFVDRPARGLGVGTALAAEIRDHLAGYGLRRIMLATRDAHGVYAKAGFAPLAKPASFMVHGEN
ncbi:GNAT family N-acetyltransferase [Kitasatospora sp. NPDC006697]|uniref:GNAT family N-acetyltransferase n=1 Tax=Kitasatospora sp. NPDC006697 TaxID=3364020 RepID=UPI0036BCABD0